MLFETILIILATTTSIFMIGVPATKLLKTIIKKEPDPLKEASVRLELAKKELEAARLNKETERLYDEMYKEILDDNKTEKNKL